MVELLLFWPHLELRDSNQILSVPQEQRSAWSGGVKHLSDPLQPIQLTNTLFLFQTHDHVCFDLKVA